MFLFIFLSQQNINGQRERNKGNVLFHQPFVYENAIKSYHHTKYWEACICSGGCTLMKTGAVAAPYSEKRQFAFNGFSIQFYFQFANLPSMDFQFNSIFNSVFNSSIIILSIWLWLHFGTFWLYWKNGKCYDVLTIYMIRHKTSFIH